LSSETKEKSVITLTPDVRHLYSKQMEREESAKNEIQVLR